MQASLIISNFARSFWLLWLRTVVLRDLTRPEHTLADRDVEYTWMSAFSYIQVHVAVIENTRH